MQCIHTVDMIAQFIIIFLVLYFLWVNSVVVSLAAARGPKHPNSVISRTLAQKKRKEIVEALRCHHLCRCLLL